MKTIETPAVNRLEKGNGPVTEQTQTPKPEAPQYGVYGNGRYSKLATEAFKDAKRLLGLTEKQADKFARTLAADWGRAQFDVDVKYGKAGRLTKNGETTLRETAKAKVVETRSITLARALVNLQDVKADIGEMESNFTGFTVSKEMIEWLNS